MASFTVRVELHNASWSDYETLHEAMAAHGLHRTISSSDGKEYQLPMAEYNLVAAVEKAAVLQMAKQAAAQTGKKAAVLVTDSKGRTWDGLEPAKAKRT